MRFLIFRPQAKCKSSAAAFNAAGLDAVACGLIDIQLDQSALSQLPTKMSALQNDSLIIVTSTVAAEQCVILKEQWPMDVTFYAVGQSSADILNAAGLQAIVPQEARSEGLLSLPQLQNVKYKKVVIVKGFGGRELLADTLIARGAKVTEWELYKRVSIEAPLSTDQWQADQIQCIIATSGEVIDAAFTIFSPSWLQSKLWIVVSQRIADIASDKGITHIHISQNASDHALIISAKHAEPQIKAMLTA